MVLFIQLTGPFHNYEIFWKKTLKISTLKHIFADINLKDNENFLRPIPTNFTLNWTKIQPLNVQGGPNGYVKRYMKNKFGEWYSTQVTQVLDTGKEIDEMKFL